MFRQGHPFRGLRQRLWAFFLAVILLLAQVACIGHTDPVFRVKPPETIATKGTTVATTKEKKTKPREEKTSASETPESKEEVASTSEEVTYDFSREHQVNLADYAGVNYGPPQLSENPASMDGLHALVQHFLAERGLSGASISIVYDDLVTQERYSYNPDQRYIAASVIKVAMAMVVEQLRQEGAIPQDAQVTYVPGDQFTATNLDSSRLGQTVSIDELISSALIYSDNAATSILFEYFRRNGRDLHYFMDERCGTNYSIDITMSAREGIGLIEALYYYQNQFPAYGSILGTMSSNSWGQYLTGGIPVGVSSKYGQLGALNHEIGLVWTDRPFAYAVFSDNINAYTVLPELGALLYNYATGQAQIPPLPSESEEASAEPATEPVVPDQPQAETGAQSNTAPNLQPPAAPTVYQWQPSLPNATPSQPPAPPLWP